jgi:heat shock protein HslJ
MKACEDPLMKQEQAFLGVLQGVERFEIRPDGTLVLHAADKRSITARRESPAAK